VAAVAVKKEVASTIRTRAVPTPAVPPAAVSVAAPAPSSAFRWWDSSRGVAGARDYFGAIFARGYNTISMRRFFALTLLTGRYCPNATAASRVGSIFASSWR